MNWLSHLVVWLSDILYRTVARPLIFRLWSAQEAHEKVMKWLARGDRSGIICWFANFLQKHSGLKNPTQIGDIELSQSFILAAGFVKGVGFATDEEAMHAVKARQNIIPGYRVMPSLVGLVEFGSFTRHARIGNPGTVIWRDEASQSTQNRVGLRNPGAEASAEFMALNKSELPLQFGINIAVSPGIDDLGAQIDDVLGSFRAFVSRGVIPTWFTLNISCPNTEDDPIGNQTEESTRRMSEAVIQYLRTQNVNVPLWVKVSPMLSRNQYDILTSTLDQTGVAAIVATNTMAAPVADDPNLNAGVGGGLLAAEALSAVNILRTAKQRKQLSIEIIACGGILEGNDYRKFVELEISAVQYWSALIFRGPLAAPIIYREMKKENARQTDSSRQSITTH